MNYLAQNFKFGVEKISVKTLDQYSPQFYDESFLKGYHLYEVETDHKFKFVNIDKPFESKI